MRHSVVPVSEPLAAANALIRHGHLEAIRIICIHSACRQWTSAFATARGDEAKFLLLIALLTFPTAGQHLSNDDCLEDNLEEC